MVRRFILVFIFIILTGCPEFPILGLPSVERAWTYYEDGKYQKAINEFKDVIESEPDNGKAYNGLGWCNGIIGELSIAVDDFNIAIEKDSSLIDPYAGLAFVYSDIPLDQNTVDAATTLIEKDSLYIFVHNIEITVSDVRLVKAKSLCNLGDFASALVEVRILNPSFNCNIYTPEGREALLCEIERLRGII